MLSRRCDATVAVFGLLTGSLSDKITVMRLNATQIKEAILHPNSEVRVKAIEYFVSAFSDELSVMPVVIKAVETHGRESSMFHSLRRADALIQSPATIDWLISELNLDCERDTKQWDNYLLAVALIVCNADPELLIGRREQIVSATGFDERLIPRIDNRIRLYRASWRTCWENLAEFCMAHAEDESFTLGTTRIANEIVDALGQKLIHDTDARSACESEFDGLDRGVTGWLSEWSRIRLAGATRDSTAIPWLLEKLAVFDFEFCDEADTALSRIGTDEVVLRIEQAFPGANDVFRNWCTDPLRNIHSESVVGVCLRLLDVEPDEDVAVSLGHALLAHFDDRAVDPVYRLLMDLGQDGLDLDSADLVYDLLLSCTIMEQRFPEYDELMDFAEETKWGWGDFEEPRLSDTLFDESQTLKGAIGEILTEGNHPRGAEFEEMNSRRLPSDRSPVGRHDPCPCGSGREYHECCLGADQSDLPLN